MLLHNVILKQNAHLFCVTQIHNIILLSKVQTKKKIGIVLDIFPLEGKLRNLRCIFRHSAVEKYLLVFDIFF